jgi:tRNA(Ile2) C34 agmatinyltransferase TiaS
MKCDRRTRHAIRTPPAGREYFECRRCGNRVDEKAFVYDSMDPL